MSKNEIQTNVLESRKMTIEKDVSALSDTDLAEMITKLQGQMTNLEVNKTLEAQFQGTKATLKEFWGTLRNSKKLTAMLENQKELKP